MTERSAHTQHHGDDRPPQRGIYFRVPSTTAPRRTRLASNGHAFHAAPFGGRGPASPLKPLTVDGTRGRAPARLVLSRCDGGSPGNAPQCRGNQHLLLPADSRARRASNTLQHWLWQRLQAPAASPGRGMTRVHSSAVNRSPSRRAFSGGHIMVIKIVPNDKGNPAGKTRGCRAALHRRRTRRLEADRIRRVGARRSGSGRNVTFPARQYGRQMGDRRSLRCCAPVADANGAGTSERARTAGVRRVRGGTATEAAFVGPDESRRSRQGCALGSLTQEKAMPRIARPSRFRRKATVRAAEKAIRVSQETARLNRSTTSEGGKFLEPVCTLPRHPARMVPGTPFLTALAPFLLNSHEEPRPSANLPRKASPGRRAGHVRPVFSSKEQETGDSPSRRSGS